MPLLFGWGHQKVKEVGPIEKQSCENCGNETFWQLYVVSTYFTLFFVPVLPYLTKRFLACPICGNSIEISKEEFPYYQNLAIINNAYNIGEITEEEQTQLINELTQVFCK